MIEKNIKHIAYQLRQNKNDGQGAIVFIGAGCSVSAGIPTAKEIAKEVRRDYADHPNIRYLEEEPEFESIMKCLVPAHRKKIIGNYVTKAKINVSHIYLANLMHMGYVDYIVTVNFDNLAQKALALYNVFPPIYDISIFKDITTTPLETKSIIYLHGQHNGVWQLNTKDEMEKNSEVVKIILHKITNNRTWIVVGYSGNDFVFDRLVELGRFDNGLYWVEKEKDELNKTVRINLLDKPCTESYSVKVSDSDAFFLELNSELECGRAKIFSNPFSLLLDMYDKIKDDNIWTKRSFDGPKTLINDAIKRYENTDSSDQILSQKEIDNIKKEDAFVDYLISGKYDGIEVLEKQVKNERFTKLLAIILGLNLNQGEDPKSQARAKIVDDFINLLPEKLFELLSNFVNEEFDSNRNFYKWAIKESKDNRKDNYWEAIKMLRQVVDEGISYTLSCEYAKAKNEDMAIRLLEICLHNGKATFESVEKDPNWEEIIKKEKYKTLKREGRL